MQPYGGDACKLHTSSSEAQGRLEAVQLILVNM